VSGPQHGTYVRTSEPGQPRKIPCLRLSAWLVDCCEAAIRSSDSLEVPEFSVPLEATGTLEARPPLTAAARRRGGIRPGRGDVAEAVTAAVAHSGTPAPAKGAFTAEKRPLTPSDLISDAGVILRLGHSISGHA
jgi:hypothetical protein